MRFRTDGVRFKVSTRFTLDGSFLSAIIAASAFSCTSRVRSTSSLGFGGILGIEGFRVKRYGDGEVSGVVLMGSPTSGGGEEAIVGNDGILLGITKGSGSALDCTGSSIV